MSLVLVEKPRLSAQQHRDIAADHDRLADALTATKKTTRRPVDGEGIVFGAIISIGIWSVIGMLAWWFTK